MNVRRMAKFYFDYSYNKMGGPLHIYLHDGNEEDGHIEFCLNEAEKEKDPLAVLLCLHLLEISPQERYEIYEWLWERE